MLKPPEYLVWWLTQKDYVPYPEPHGCHPPTIPAYAWEQRRARYGRAGRGRLWVPEHIEVQCMPVEADDPRWAPLLDRDAGGIVIEAKDAEACARWGGTFTTLTLDPVEVKSC